jgi:hypothetical protein
LEGLLDEPRPGGVAIHHAWSGSGQRRGR